MVEESWSEEDEAFVSEFVRDCEDQDECEEGDADGEE
jgi:hypothetical protein